VVDVEDVHALGLAMVTRVTGTDIGKLCFRADADTVSASPRCRVLRVGAHDE